MNPYNLSLALGSLRVEEATVAERVARDSLRSAEIATTGPAEDRCAVFAAECREGAAVALREADRKWRSALHEYQRAADHCPGDYSTGRIDYAQEGLSRVGHAHETALHAKIDAQAEALEQARVDEATTWLRDELARDPA